MREQQLIGLGIMLLILALACIAAAWLQHRHERRGRRGKHAAAPVQVQAVPEPGSFTAAVLNAARDAETWHQAVYCGNAAAVAEQLRRAQLSGAILVSHLVQREIEARNGQVNSLYANEPGSVSVAESDRLAGEPYTSPGDHNEAKPKPVEWPPNW